MGKTESLTEMKINVDDNESSTHVDTQYGVRLPDGTHAWGAVESAGIRANLQGLLGPGVSPSNRQTYRGHWDRYLTEKAKAANISPEKYASMHTFVKRTVVLAVTDIEVVTSAAAATAETSLDDFDL